MSEMKDRIARVIWITVGGTHRTEADWDALPEGPMGMKALFRSVADKVFAEMREPTEEMLDAVKDVDILNWSLEPGEGLDSIDIDHAWQVMIDEARK